MPVSSASTRHPLVDPVFRALFSLIFLVAGTGHLTNTAHIVSRLEKAALGHLATSVAPAELLVLLSGVALLLGGTGLLLGYRTRWAALGLIAVLLPITITVQIGRPTLGPLFKNIALLGGLLFFAANGAGAYSLDARRTAVKHASA